MTKFRKLGRLAAHRDVHAQFRTMVSQLVKHERIERTFAKGTLSSARRAAAFVCGDDVLHKLFTELAYRYKDRAGGYTRLLRTCIPIGDAASMAYIEFINRENEFKQSNPPFVCYEGLASLSI